jgi:hypothetical protein
MYCVAGYTCASAGTAIDAGCPTLLVVQVSVRTVPHIGPDYIHSEHLRYLSLHWLRTRITEALPSAPFFLDRI